MGGGGGGGGRFDSAAGADDPLVVLAAVRRSIFQVCNEQVSAELERLQPVLASGSPSEVAAAVRAASLVLDEAAEVLAEADAFLRLKGLADNEATGWVSRRAHLEQHINQCRRLMAAMERAPPESRGIFGHGLQSGMSRISWLTSSWCRMPPLMAYCAWRPAPRLSASELVDDLASWIEGVQVSAEEE